MTTKKTAGASKLNLACGQDYLDGWINIDNNSMFPGSKVDLNKDILTLDWPENSVEEIRVSHFVMYTRPEELAPLLKRWYSWLKKGGKLEIETSNLDKLVDIVASNISQESVDDYGLTNLFGTLKTGPHRWAWSPTSLANLVILNTDFDNLKVTEGRKKPSRDFLLTCIKN